MSTAQILFNNDPNLLVSNFLKEQSFTQLGVVVDTNTKSHCYSLVKEALPIHLLVEVSAGEESKNLETCTQIWQQLTELNFDRHSFLLVIGGGVLGDMAGFCAATYKRGINFALVPTTLLAQVDASVGGKMGIDFLHFKNQIGVFQEPVATLISSTFIHTLPERELRSGFAEVIKHCLIADKEMWDQISRKSFDEQDWHELIVHSVEIKKKITSHDPREQGLRKILNFGHTFGHALETHYLAINMRIFHGEAIAMGMIMEAFVACEKNFVSKVELNSICNFVGSVFKKPTQPFDHALVMALMNQDKKNKGDKILMALPKGIGESVWDQEVSTAEVKKAFEFYENL
ncbi:MAG: 3-dehydroquinate synthase [Cyclobacteriaceae bacterium]|nr:3-dehydroquinate synthase [Cyclobacteriaceae bacterium]